MLRREPPSHTFLLRIWIEECPPRTKRFSWRGHITHLPDEDRSYVESDREIAAFIRRHVVGSLDQ